MSDIRQSKINKGVSFGRSWRERVKGCVSGIFSDTLTILFSNIYKRLILIISSFIAKDEQAEKEREEVFLSSFKEFWKSLDSLAIQPDKKDVLVNTVLLLR